MKFSETFDANPLKFHEIQWNKRLKYGDVHYEAEVEYSKYNFDYLTNIINNKKANMVRKKNGSRSILKYSIFKSTEIYLRITSHNEASDQ